MTTETTTEAVAEPAKAETVAEIVETTPEQQAEAKARDDKGRFSKPPEERIAEVTRKMREQERETAYWRGRAETHEKPAEPVKAVKPTPDKFEDYGAYVEALADWKANEIVDAKLSKREQELAEKAQAETRAKTWSERIAEATKAFPDYDDVMMNAADLRITDHVAEVLRDSDAGGTLLYHLAKNPQLLDRVNAMTLTQAARELGKFEASLEKKSESPEEVAETPPQATPRKTTNAPAPAKPLGSGRSTAVDLRTASMDEYKAARKAQGARWAR